MNRCLDDAEVDELLLMASQELESATEKAQPGTSKDRFSSPVMSAVLLIVLTMHFISSPCMDKPRPDCWYTRTPVGHNMLSRTVSHLFEEAGVTGHFTNHLLRATVATHV